MTISQVGPLLREHPTCKLQKAPGKRSSSATLAAGIRPLRSGGVFKSAAVEVLRRQQTLLSTGEICRLALEWGLLRCSGKTPEATMASCLYSDIKRYDTDSLFVRYSSFSWILVPHDDIFLVKNMPN